MEVSSGRSPSAGRRERREVVRRGGSGLVGRVLGREVDGSAVKASLLSLVGSSEGVLVVFWEEEEWEVNSSGGWYSSLWMVTMASSESNCG